MDKILVLALVIASFMEGLLSGLVLPKLVAQDKKNRGVERSNGQEVPPEDKAKEQARQEEQRQFDNLMRYDGSKQ